MTNAYDGWTTSAQNGVTLNSCNQWTSNEYSMYGVTGQSGDEQAQANLEDSFANQGWGVFFKNHCDIPTPIYCVQQPD